MAFDDGNLNEPHQVKLSKFIADVPAVGAGDVRSVMPDSKIYPTPYDLDKRKAFTGVKSNPKFTLMTGYTQDMLLDKWVSDRTTTCNEFVSRCGGAMGYQSEGKYDGLGMFDIMDVLTRYGRGHCWVPATSGSKPAYGDIFRSRGTVPDHNGVRKNHMGLSLHFEGNKWYTIESGQGGPSTGYDAIKRKVSDWMPPDITGWVDMKSLLASGQRLPYWLGGWWEVTQGTYDVWYYWFESLGKVICESRKPLVLSQPPINPMLLGNYVVKNNTVEISWQSVDGNESFTLTQNEPKVRKTAKFGMTGKIDGSSEPIKAQRMLIVDYQ